MQIMHFNVCDWDWRKTDENKSGNALPIVAAMFVGTLCDDRWRHDPLLL